MKKPRCEKQAGRKDIKRDEKAPFEKTSGAYKHKKSQIGPRRKIWQEKTKMQNAAWKNVCMKIC